MQSDLFFTITCMLVIKLSSFFFFFFHSVQQLNMGSQLLDQELNLGCSSESTKS